MPERVAQPVPMLDFSRQFSSIREEVFATIEQVCTSQRFILGPQVASFEAAVASFLTQPYGPEMPADSHRAGSAGYAKNAGKQTTLHAIGCANGTDALWLALAAARLGEADAVVTSPFSFFASVSAILRAGARPLLADIDPVTFNLSPACVAPLFEQHANLRAILPVHLFGQCADMDAFEAIGREHKALIIEDAAQAFGATWTTPKYPPRFAGTLGIAAAFSFYPTKYLAAMGDAGLVTSTDESVAERARMLRAHGMRRRYFHDEIGWNSRLDTLQAAVLEIKLRSLPEGNRRRRNLAARYDQLFHEAGLCANQGTTVVTASLPVALPQTDPRAGHVFHQYTIRAQRRDELRAHLAHAQIGSEIYYPLPLHLQTALAHLGYKAGDFPVAEQAAAEVLSLPMYPELREDEQDTVVAAIADFYS